MYYTQIVAFPLEAMKLTNHIQKFFEFIVNAPSLGFHFNVHYRSCKDMEKEVTVFYHANVLLSQIKISNKFLGQYKLKNLNELSEISFNDLVR